MGTAHAMSVCRQVARDVVVLSCCFDQSMLSFKRSVLCGDKAARYMVMSHWLSDCSIGHTVDTLGYLLSTVALTSPHSHINHETRQLIGDIPLLAFHALDLCDLTHVLYKHGWCVQIPLFKVPHLHNGLQVGSELQLQIPPQKSAKHAAQRWPRQRALKPLAKPPRAQRVLRRV